MLLGRERLVITRAFRYMTRRDYVEDCIASSNRICTKALHFTSSGVAQGYLVRRLYSLDMRISPFLKYSLVVLVPMSLIYTKNFFIKTITVIWY